MMALKWNSVASVTQILNAFHLLGLLAKVFYGV